MSRPFSALKATQPLYTKAVTFSALLFLSAAPVSLWAPDTAVQSPSSSSHTSGAHHGGASMTAQSGTMASSKTVSQTEKKAKAQERMDADKQKQQATQKVTIAVHTPQAGDTNLDFSLKQIAAQEKEFEKIQKTLDAAKLTTEKERTASKKYYKELENIASTLNHQNATLRQHSQDTKAKEALTKSEKILSESETLIVTHSIKRADAIAAEYKKSQEKIVTLLSNVVNEQAEESEKISETGEEKVKEKQLEGKKRFDNAAKRRTDLLHTFQKELLAAKTDLQKYSAAAAVAQTEKNAAHTHMAKIDEALQTIQYDLTMLAVNGPLAAMLKADAAMMQFNLKETEAEALRKKLHNTGLSSDEKKHLKDQLKMTEQEQNALMKDVEAGRKALDSLAAGKRSTAWKGKMTRAGNKMTDFSKKNKSKGGKVAALATIAGLAAAVAIDGNSDDADPSSPPDGGTDPPLPQDKPPVAY